MDILDPALLRSGRLDRKIEFPMPNEEARARIMQIHSRKMNVRFGPIHNASSYISQIDMHVMIKCTAELKVIHWFLMYYSESVLFPQP